MTPGAVAAGLAALVAALAAALLVGPRQSSPPGVAGGHRRAPVVLLGPAAGGLVLLGAAGVLPGRRLVLLVVGVAALGGAAVLAGRRRERRLRQETAARVLEACADLRAELLAGRTPGEALRRAAQAWPALGPVAETDRLGGDVPAALRAVAGTPGAADLHHLAAAWHVAHRSGSGLAGTLGRVAQDLVAQRSLRRVVEGELASARATARLVAALPVVALLMGSGAGGDPVAFLLDTPAGLACLAGGLTLVLLGLGWIEAVAAGVERGAR